MESWRLKQTLDKLLLERYKKIGWCKDIKGYEYAKKDAITYNKFLEELTPVAIKIIEEDKQEEAERRKLC